MEQSFTDFKIYIKYFQNAKSQIKLQIPIRILFF